MVFASSFITFLTLALTGAATPVVTPGSYVRLPFVKVVNTTGFANIVKNDLARIKALKARSTPVVFESRASSEPVTNDIVSYIAAVRISCALFKLHNLT